MAQSILEWIRTHERRYAGRNQQVTGASSDLKEFSAGEEASGGDKLDRFFPKSKSAIFDDEFSLDDFRDITRKWLQDHDELAAI